ncbi:MAG: hypothetical protein WCZ28_02765 [Burkholderiaceae bacterium]
MSDWEEFCESNGWNAGSPEDYDKFLDSLEDKPRRRRDLAVLQFATFDEAKEWAKTNPGKSFTRNPNGPGFIPVRKRNEA